MNKVFCFGELLLHFSPQLQGKWINDARMPVYVGGAELNVATALALWEIPVKYGSAAPENYLTKEIIHHLVKKNIDTSSIILGGSRLGTYYLPQGADLKNAGVIYDRAFSSFSELQPGQLDWDSIFSDVKWFHFSAINPALNKNVAMVCKEALEIAMKKNIFISVDLNYREKLWQYGQDPKDVMPDLVQHCNLVMGNIWAAEKMLGIAIDPKMKDNRNDYLVQAEKTSADIIKHFPNCKHVANTFRFNQDEGILYYATLYHNDKLFIADEKKTSKIVDRVGSGDCFMAGLIYSILHSFSPQQTIDFAVLAAFNKLFITGDNTTSSVDEIKNFSHDE
jgi:2-dehydro-3-deoxygluconokinase